MDKVKDAINMVVKRFGVKPDKQVIICVILTGILVIELLFLVPLGINKMRVVSKKTNKIKRDLVSIKKEDPLKDDYLNRQTRLKDEIQKLYAQAIFPQQESKILSFISSASKGFNVDIQALRPFHSKDYIVTKGGDFKYLPITVKARSRFHNLVRFLDYLQKSSYFFQVKELRILSGVPYHSIEMVICGLIREEK